LTTAFQGLFGEGEKEDERIIVQCEKGCKAKKTKTKTIHQSATKMKHVFVMRQEYNVFYSYQSAFQDSIREIGALQIRAFKVSAPKVGSDKFGVHANGTKQCNPLKISSTEISTTEISFGKL